MRIALNLASRPWADLNPVLKQLRIAMGILALIACALTLGIHAFHEKAVQARAREHALDLQLAALNQEHQSYEQRMKLPENAGLIKQVTSLNQLFDEKSFSWTLAMEDLETVLPNGVQAVTLEPERAKNGRTTLHMRVVGPRDKTVELVRNLEHSRYFILPAIVGESAESDSGPGHKLEPISPSNRFNFDVIATYNPEAITDTSRRPRIVDHSEPQDSAPAPVVNSKSAPGRSAVNAIQQRPVPPRMNPVNPMQRRQPMNSMTPGNGIPGRRPLPPGMRPNSAGGQQ